MNTYFRFRQFTVHQEHCAMKVSTDSCLFGAWVAANHDVASRVLDIGAGTGLLSLMLAQGTQSLIDAVEIEAGCFEQMHANIVASPWAQRIQGIQGDIRTIALAGEYDLIISNPPFYEKQLSSPDRSINAARHSTSLSLEELLRRICMLLKTDGQAFVLLPSTRQDELLHMSEAEGLHARTICLARHSPRHPWYRVMVAFSKVKAEVKHQTIEIRDETGNYSEAFSALMQPYYL